MSLSEQPTFKPVMTVSMHNRTLQMTREGIGFVLLSFTIGVGAINTGNNLLYLILAMCCSFIAVSGILSEITLQNVVIEGFAPRNMYAKNPTPITLKLTNKKKRVPSYSLRITLSREGRSRFQLDRDLYFFHIRPGQSEEKTVMLTAEKRGRLQIDGCRLSSSFPFGFFVKIKSLPLKIDTVVYPEIRKVQLPTPNQDSFDGQGTIKPFGEDLYELREFRPGDSLAAVHWKSSAKTETLRVKKFLAGGRHNFTIFLNLIDPQTNRTVEDAELEHRVIESASLAYHLIRRGDEVSLKTHETKTPFGASEAHLKSLMGYLAFVGTEDAKPKAVASAAD